MLGRIINNPAIRYFLEAREELRKVTWPQRREVMIYSSLVIAFSVVTAAYFGLLDWLFTLGLEKLVTLTNNI
ncbi:MAG: preprotein translocase subunit SecE [Patescibacteria group bacterium]